MQKNISSLWLALTYTLILGACQMQFQSIKPSENAVVIDKPQTKNRGDDLYRLTEEQIKRAKLKTVPVETNGMAQELEFSSVIEAPFEEIGTVSPQMNGVVSRVLVDLGDHVRKGQVLLYVNSPDVAEAQSNYFDALAKMTSARAEMELIKTRIDVAEKDRQRLKDLVDEGISSKKDLEASQGRYAATRAELVAAEATYKAAQAQLAAAGVKLKALGISKPQSSPDGFTSELPLLSPRDGIVIQRNVVAGQGVSPTMANYPSSNAANNANAVTSHALLSIANLKKVWVMLEVPQSQISYLDLDSLVKFETEVAPGEVFWGKITKMGQHYDPVSHCVQVRTEIDNSRGLLKPGMMIIAKVSAKSHKQAGLTVASQALQNIEGKDFVFVKTSEQTFAQIEVKRLGTNGATSQIEGKLKPGEEVVGEGSFYLKTEAVKRAMGDG